MASFLKIGWYVCLYGASMLSPQMNGIIYYDWVFFFFVIVVVASAIVVVVVLVVEYLKQQKEVAKHNFSYGNQ